MNVVETHGLSKDYGNGRGVLELDLEIPAGEIFGFIGPNGAGKSTTIRTLLDLIRPTAGAARIFGKDPRIHGPEIRKHIGYLPGDPELPGAWSARVYLKDLVEIRGDVDPRYMGHLIKRLGANLDDPIRRLSKGNKQKIGLIQAFMHRPDLLILDEPTDGLDPLLRREVHKLLAEARAAGRTVFLSSHVIHEVEQICDRIGLINDSRLVLVDHVKAMRERLEQHVSLRLTQPIDLARLRAVPGVGGLQHRGDRVRFRWQGPTASLVRLIATLPTARVDIQQQKLEDAILYLYEA